MKVLFDNQVFRMQKFGGVNRYFTELMKINESGINVEITNTIVQPTSIKGNSLFEKGISFVNRKLNIEKKPKTPANFINTFPGLTFDIFHPTYYDPYFLNLIHKPFVLTVYDMINEIFGEYLGPFNPVSNNKRTLCENADEIITISETTKQDLIDIFKIPESKVHAISLASDFDTIIPQKPDSAEGLNNYILFVGSRAAYKNFYFTLIALSELLKNDKDLLLVCTGHAFSEDEIERFKILKIESQVKHIYLKSDNELAWAYKNARLFVFPSLYEGFGLPLLEAFAKDCPVISTKCGSLEEVGGNAALYFDAKSITQIQDAAYKALYDTEVRNELIIKGRNQLKKFSWDTCRSQTAEVYKRLINI